MSVKFVRIGMIENMASEMVSRRRMFSLLGLAVAAGLAIPVANGEAQTQGTEAQPQGTHPHHKSPHGHYRRHGTHGSKPASHQSTQNPSAAGSAPAETP